MARQRKVENETEEQAETRRLLERVANTANRSDKVSWNRKMDNMTKLISLVNGLQERIQALELEKEPYLDEIAELRNTMVNECIHPFDQLVYNGDYVLCKFCNKKIVPADGT